MDLSWPTMTSVNSGINKDLYLGEDVNLKYPTVDSLVDILLAKGHLAELFKVDLKRAYRQIYVDPCDIHLLEFRWKGSLYIDRTLPFGLRSAAHICQRVTNMIRYILLLKGVSMVNFLDDFGGAEVPSYALQSYHTVGETVCDIGVEENIKKSAAPNTSMVFLGVLLDSVKLDLRITSVKLSEIKEILPEWITRKRAS